MDPPAATSHMHYLVKKGGFVTLRHNNCYRNAWGNIEPMLSEISKGEEMMVKKKKLD